MERLQKVLAQAGIASRRAAEQIILAGRVRVDGKIVRELGTQVDPRKSRVEVDGNKIVAEKLIYIVLHKPRGVVCTLSDPEGRPTIHELLKEVGARVVPVGRLDFHTSGALLCTNDGEFAQALAHPKLQVPKVYVAKVKGTVEDDALERFGQRIVVDGRPTQPAQVKRLRFEGDKTWLEITLREGRNRQVRKLGEATGFPVMRLARISHAGVTSEDLRPGQWRPLSVDELVDLKKNYGVPKKVRAPEFVPAEKVAKGQRRPARPDIRGEIHKNPKRPPDKRESRFADREARPDTRGSAVEGRPSRGEGRTTSFEGRPARGGGRVSADTRAGGRRANRQTSFQREPAPSEFSGRKKPFVQSEFAGRKKPFAPSEFSNRKAPPPSARGPREFSSREKPSPAARGPREFSNRKSPSQDKRGPSAFSSREKPSSAERGQRAFSSRKEPSPAERGQHAFSSATKPLQRERGQSPRHDDLNLPWKERSRSAIERRVSTNSARPSADRASKHQGRETPRAQRGGEQSPRDKPNHRTAPTARRDVPKSSPRRGTSR
jgi:23S rRNA pseudouridine2605 synthase